MPEEEIVREDGLTFGEIFRIVKKRLWVVLASCAAFTLLLILLLVFLINPSMISYSITFRMIFPTQGEAVYPDGSPFFYQEIVSEEYLNKAKESSAEYSSVDVGRMLKENAVTLTVSSEGGASAEGPYTLRIDGSYFKNEDQADGYLHMLANFQPSILLSRAEELSYSIDAETFRKVPLPERIQLLEQQRATILARYDFWIRNYSEAYSVNINAQQGIGTIASRPTLGGLRTQVTTLFGGTTQSDYLNEIESKGYAYTSDFEAYRNSLVEEYKDNESEIAQIQGLLATMTGNIEIPERLLELIARNSRIQRWLDLQEDGSLGSHPTLTEAGNNAFIERLDAEYDGLEAASKTLTKVITAIYSQGSKVLYEEQSVQTEGGLSAWLCGILAFVGSFLIACVVLCSVERSKQRGEGKKKETSNAESQDGSNK